MLATATTTAPAFVIYREGNVLQLELSQTKNKNLTQSNGLDISTTPILRICALDGQRLLMLNCKQQLLLGTCRSDVQRLQLELLLEDVSDVDFCRSTHTVYIVTGNGSVYGQITHNTISASDWKAITFDPLELSEEGIRIVRVKCSMHGVLFVTTSNDIYAMGSCGDIFQAEAQPQHLRLFEQRKQIIDLVAGDEHFVLLLREEIVDEQEEIEGNNFSTRPTANRSAISTVRSRRSPQRVASTVSVPLEPSETVKQHKRNSSSASANSLSSQASPSQHSAGDCQDTTLQRLLRKGYALLQTEVHTFGDINGGLLGTGDHIKRPNVYSIEKLTGVGVCAIAAGREHSIARTLDGRLFHWGMNSRLQLNSSNECADLSAPQELKLDGAEMSDTERSILAACCGDYQTLLLNAEGALYARHVQLRRDLLSWQGNFENTQQISMAPFILATGCFTLHNIGPRTLHKKLSEPLSSLQLQLQALLQQRSVVEALLAFQQKNNCLIIRQLLYICQCFVKLLFYAAVALHSVECYYRGDFANATELIFVHSLKPTISLFEEYTRAYCDVRSMNGFVEAARIYTHFSNLYAPTTSKASEVPDLERLFQQPFKMLPTFMQCLELFAKSSLEFTKPLLTWKSFTQQQRIDLELANTTQEFWLRNDRSMKLRHFRFKTRRFILSSETVPLRLGNSALNLLHPTFILFSDCFCQLGTNLQTFPLVAMWLKSENDKTLRVTTPEKSFTLVARSEHDKILWYDQLERAIAAALGRPDGKLSGSRRMEYVYSSKHAKYGGVVAYGQWRNGVMHGSCYLQFPNEKFYLGEVRHGEIEGYGKMVIPSVGVYEGNFKSGKFHGYGCFEMKDNEVYTGNFRDGLFHGHGMLRTDVFSYVGEFQCNARSGYGIQDNAVSGEKYMGMFVDNKRMGAGTCITMSGDYFEGIFVNNELTGQGIAVFKNEYFYEGELTLSGPNGKGVYYMPYATVECENSHLEYDNTNSKQQMIGNILSGQLVGTWTDVSIVSGSVAMNRQFARYPKSIGDLVIDNSRKWRSLFENFEEEIVGADCATYNTKELWNRIAIYMTTLRERDKSRVQQDSAYQSYVQSFFAKNISMGFSASMDKISLKSANSLLTNSKSNILDTSDDALRLLRRSYSQETLFECDLNDLDFMNSTTFPNNEDHSFHNLLNAQLGNWANDSSSSLHSSFDSVLNLSSNSRNNSFTTQNGLDFIPKFGMTSLNAEDVDAIKEYLVQAFKDPHHPLHLLNQRIANSFYSSYGCWKVKPTPILAKQAMREWESISKRVYRFVRKMFPALPEDYCVIESTREVVSHITLLYPIVLSEGIYSTLFVLYANKYSDKDEMYRQNLLFAEKLKDLELSQCLGLDSMLLPVVSNECFHTAIQTLKQVQEKYSPKAMLIVIEKCMQLITEAHKLTENESTAVLAADSMMPLTLFLVLRAAVPHLGAELALLDDLTGGSNFQIEMNGFAGYCYTTLKASYEHLTLASLKKS